MASLRHRRDVAEAEDYADDGSSSNEAGATTEEEEEEDHRRLHLGLDSMTAKGIQHLCSELLEINKASEHDFRANVYLSYFSFIRMFQEAGVLEEDLHQHVLGHGRLFQHLSDNYLDSSSMLQVLGGGAAIIRAAAADDHYEDELELEQLELELDVLLSEHRMEEALELLELRGKALKRRITTGDQAATLLSSMKAKVADRFASVADNRRVPRPELLKALSGLCKLGEAQRANHLLFKFYRPAASSQQSSSWNNKSSSSSYIKDLACMVFSSIVEASRSFVSLHGHPSPHTPQLIRWAREEMEDFTVAFSEYVKSSSMSQALALEAAKCALSYSCSMLMKPPLRAIVSEQDLLDLIAPCLQEVIAVYARHLKEVARLFVASDAWVLGRFPVSGIQLLARGSRSPAAMEAGLQIEYCLLTTSGRKFLTLIQDAVEDVYPLLDLGINNSVLQLVAELFREYMHSIVELMIPTKEVVALQDQDEDHLPQYTWQLSILINCTTLVSLFPIVAHGMFKSDQTSSVVLAQGELDSLTSLIKEAAGQVWTCFCQQFIRDAMSCLQKSGDEGIATSPQQGITMPSFPFQVLFGRVRQLNNLYGTILTGKDGGEMKNLLQELMEAMILWLSNNLGSWIHHAQGIPRDKLCQQLQLDVHFLLEFAQLGGFSSENIRTVALDLLTTAEEKLASEHDSTTTREDDSCGRGWATDAAKHAIGVLMAIGTSSSSHQEANVQNVVADAQEDELLVMDTSEEYRGSVAFCDGGKSSTDEFISIEEEDSSMSSEQELLIKLGHRAVPEEYYSEVDGEEAEVRKDHDDNPEAGDDHDSRSAGESPAKMCHQLQAVEQAVSSSNRRRTRKREAAVSNRPRWQ